MLAALRLAGHLGPRRGLELLSLSLHRLDLRLGRLRVGGALQLRNQLRQPPGQRGDVSPQLPAQLHRAR